MADPILIGKDAHYCLAVSMRTRGHLELRPNVGKAFKGNVIFFLRSCHQNTQAHNALPSSLTCPCQLSKRKENMTLPSSHTRADDLDCLTCMYNMSSNTSTLKWKYGFSWVQIRAADAFVSFIQKVSPSGQAVFRCPGQVLCLNKMTSIFPTNAPLFFSLTAACHFTRQASVNYVFCVQNWTRPIWV